MITSHFRISGPIHSNHAHYAQRAMTLACKHISYESGTLEKLSLYLRKGVSQVGFEMIL